MPPELGPVPSLSHPLRDQRLIGASQAAQVGHGLALLEVLLALAYSRADRDPGNLGQQVGAAAGDLPQLCRPGGFLVLSQAAPAGMTPGRAGQLGHDQPVRVRSEAITSHLARVEHACASGKQGKAAL